MRDCAQQDSGKESHGRGAAPPSPSPTPPVPCERCDLPLPEQQSITVASKVRIARLQIPHESQASRPTASRTSLPVVRRSTGKKASRPRAVALNRRANQPLKKTRRENADIDDSRYHPREVLEVEPGALDPRTPEAEQVTDIAANEAVVRRKASRQNLLSPRDPVNPYDDPKYFSPLTVVGKDGVMQPIFKFYPHPATVEEQWAEYKYGLHGQKPVELLEKMYRAKWRNGTYGRSWFTRRKAFWDKVKGLLDQGRTEEEALGILRDLGSGSVPTVVAILCKERGGGTRPGRRKSRGQSVYSVCGSKRSRDESSSNEESSSSESEDDEAPRPIRYNPSRLRKRLVVSMDRVSGSDEPESAQYSEQETDGLGT